MLVFTQFSNNFTQVYLLLQQKKKKKKEKKSINEPLTLKMPNKNCSRRHFNFLLLPSVVVLLFYVHGKHLKSCPDGQLT